MCGPRGSEFQRRTGQRVQTYNINNVNRPQRMSINNNTVNVYRPQVTNSPRGANARPERFVEANPRANNMANANEVRGGRENGFRNGEMRGREAGPGPRPPGRIG